MKSTGTIILLIGLIILVLAVFADLFGIGAAASFGWKQWTGTVVGFVVSLIGIVMRRKG